MKIDSAEFVKSAPSIENCPAGDLPEIALAGRSNVGKSSFLNSMVNRRGLARTSNTPGRTRLINFFEINKTFYFVDLPGYGYAKVPQKMKMVWGESIQKYLENRKNLMAVILLLDIRHNPTEMDNQLYSFLSSVQLPVITVATKADKLSNNQAINQLRLIRDVLEMDVETTLVPFSAKTGRGREETWQLIETVLTKI